MDFKLPDLGEGVKEGQIVRLMIAEGDRIAEDQPLMEVETDKAAVVIPSPYSGVVKKLHVTAQQIVNVGDTKESGTGIIKYSFRFIVHFDDGNVNCVFLHCVKLTCKMNPSLPPSR